MFTENNNIREVYCYGKDIVSTVEELYASVRSKGCDGPKFEKLLDLDSRKFKVTVELLPEVTVEDCLRAAVESGKLVKDSDDHYHWVDVTRSFMALWVEHVVNLTGLKNQWKWAERKFGKKNLDKDLKYARGMTMKVIEVKKILPH